MARKGKGPSKRPTQVGELIRQCLGEMLLSGALKDDRLNAASLVRITEVKMTQDLRYARVYVSVFPEEQKLAEKVLEALEASGHRIKKLLAGELRLRYTPELVFGWDRSIGEGARMEELIREAKAEDAAIMGDKAEEAPEE